MVPVSPKSNNLQEYDKLTDQNKLLVRFFSLDIYMTPRTTFYSDPTS